MTKKIPLTLALAALVGFAAPALAAEQAAAKHDPQTVTSTAKPTKAAPAKKANQGRHAKAKSSKKTAASTTQKAATPAPAPAAK
jgi:hypothetical protein